MREDVTYKREEKRAVARALYWLHEEEHRVSALRAWHQPVTSMQLLRRCHIPATARRSLIRAFLNVALIRCLNPAANCSRVYALTRLAQRCRESLSGGRESLLSRYVEPKVNWALYGWVCFRHRRTILKTLTKPMYPAEIQRRARWQDASVQMNPANTRAVIKLMRERRIVRPVPVRDRVYPRYEPTPMGRAIQQALWRAEAVA